MTKTSKDAILPTLGCLNTTQWSLKTELIIISYDSWKEARLSVTNLLLDNRNPRIPDVKSLPSQRDLIADLIENETVHALARSIVNNGYFPVESLIYIEQEGKKYVVEGNRRLAALKLLLGPDSAPKDWERKFRLLSARANLDTLKKVRVVRAPSREAAAPIIMSRHTKQQIARWSPLQQSRYYMSLLESGLTADEISEEYNIPLTEISDAIQRDMMYSIACSLDLPEEIRKKVHNPRLFTMSTLERLYKTREVNKLLGISFDKNKKLKGSIDIREFRKAYGRIVSDIAVGDEWTSRKLNTKEEMKEYIEALGDDRPDLAKKGSFAAEDLLKGSAPKDAPPAKEGPVRKTTKQRTAPRWLIPSGISCTVKNERINDIFKELRKLPVATYTNSVALMFRGLLEMSLSYHLHRTGDLETIRGKEKEKKTKKKQRLPGDWHPTLKQMLTHIVDTNHEIVADGNLKKAIRRLVSGNNEFFSVDTLNLFVHNQHFCPDEQMLRRFWAQLEGLFEIILLEPEETE